MDSNRIGPCELPEQRNELVGDDGTVVHGEVSGGNGKANLDGEGVRFPFTLPFKVPIIEEQDLEEEENNFYSNIRIRDFSKEQESDEDDVEEEQEQGVGNDGNQEVEYLVAGSDNQEVAYLIAGSDNQEVAYLVAGSDNQEVAYLVAGSDNQEVEYPVAGSDNQEVEYQVAGSDNQEVEPSSIDNANHEKESEERKSSFNDISNLTETKASTVVVRKRGRPRKSSNAILNKKTTSSNVDSCKAQRDKNAVVRKRGRPRKSGLEIVKKYKKSSLKSVKENTLSSVYNSDAENSTSDMYSDKVYMVHDPLSDNIYFRSLLFVRLEGNAGFQCSTCAERISGKNLQLKFSNHYLAWHSDCFRCRYCVLDNRFNSIYELQHHMALVHPMLPQVNIGVGRRRGKTSINNTGPPLEKRRNRIPCLWCGLRLNSMTDSEALEHRYTHLPKERGNQLGTEATGGYLSGTRKRGRKKRINNQTDSGCARSGVALSQNEIDSRNLRVTIENQVNARVRAFTCTLCGKQLLSEMAVRNHLKFLHNGCKYPGCGKSFESVEELHTHIDMDHFFINPKYPYHCEYCGDVSMRPSLARQHTNRVRCEENKAEISAMLQQLARIVF